MSNDFTAGLLRRGLITEEKLEWARNHADWADQGLPETLIWYGLATRREVMSALQEFYKIPWLDLEETPLSQEASEYVPESIAIENRVVAIRKDQERLVIACCHPIREDPILSPQIVLGHILDRRMVFHYEWCALIQSTYARRELPRNVPPSYQPSPPDGHVGGTLPVLKFTQHAPPVFSLLDMVFASALLDGADRVHIRKSSEDLDSMRYRVCDVWYEMVPLPASLKVLETFRGLLNPPVRWSWFRKSQPQAREGYVRLKMIDRPVSFYIHLNFDEQYRECEITLDQKGVEAVQAWHQWRCHSALRAKLYGLE